MSINLLCYIDFLIYCSKSKISPGSRRFQDIQRNQPKSGLRSRHDYQKKIDSVFMSRRSRPQFNLIRRKQLSFPELGRKVCTEKTNYEGRDPEKDNTGRVLDLTKGKEKKNSNEHHHHRRHHSDTSFHISGIFLSRTN